MQKAIYIAAESVIYIEMSQEHPNECEKKLTLKIALNSKVNEELTTVNGANRKENNTVFCEEIRPPTVGQEFNER